MAFLRGSESPRRQGTRLGNSKSIAVEIQHRPSAELGCFDQRFVFPSKFHSLFKNLSLMQFQLFPNSLFPVDFHSACQLRIFSHRFSMTTVSMTDKRLFVYFLAVQLSMHQAKGLNCLDFLLNSQNTHVYHTCIPFEGNNKYGTAQQLMNTAC